MKRLTILLAAVALWTGAAAQTENPDNTEGYKFTDTKVLPTTDVKNQNRSGTCWCFSTMTFLESEIMRNGGEAMHLSEMWIVRHSFKDKAVKYVRMHGKLNFAEGGASHDVTKGIKAHGIVPFEVYPGLNYGTDKPDFHELTPVLTAYLDAVIKAGDRTAPLSTAWERGFDAILDAYFGPLPETFEYNGKQYTPQSFAASLPIDMDDYVDVTSFTHHPFYEQFIIEIPDNWMYGSVYNVPLDDMMAIIDNSLKEGYTVAWGTDVSEKGFSRTKGIGVMPAADVESMDGTEAARWGQLTEREREAALYKLDKPGAEVKVTQELRQTAFDNFQTTDDHGMVIMGTDTDQNGTEYYKVQNSWDKTEPYDGFWYFSHPFVAYKTTTITVNKNAIPKSIRKKLGM